MGPDQEQPQAKRARFADAPLQPQGAAIGGAQPAPASAPAAVPASSTTGATVALPPAAAAAVAAAQQPHKQPPPSTKPPASSSSAPASTSTTTSTAAAAAKSKASAASAFLTDAHEAVRFRAVASPTADALASEISAGGQAVSVEFLHQHFGDAEQIRGYAGLAITIWIHVRTYHVWVDVQFTAKRPGADKLGPIFEGAFPSGYCRCQEEFMATAAASAASMPDLMALGDCVGTVPLPPTAYGISATTAAASTAAAAAATGGREEGRVVEVSVRRFQISTAPPEVKALHARLEPLLLFTIDGAQFIDADDPQWELLLPVVRADDGGCLVLGLTTLFNFFAYPASCRLRVSQVLVLSPWQGLGLGKALLKLSYDLAKSRCCADLTVEDPTPNLQRVREKLEVEMMRGLPWVRDQAVKCLDAVARGDTAWPEWEGPTGQQQQQEGAEGPQQPQQPQQGQGQQPQHPLLAAHAFFSALGAVPPAKLALPESVQSAATAAAEARWRQRLEAAERDAAAAAAAALAAAAGAAGAEDAAAPAAVAVAGPCSDAAAAAGGSGSDARGSSSGGNGGGGGVSGGPLAPSAAFVLAISRELKMHRGQIRVVWEALLWCEAGARSRPGVGPALERLVTARLEVQHFSSVGRAAAAKRRVDIDRTSVLTVGEARAGAGAGGAGAKETDFFMYRPVGRTRVGGGPVAAEGAEADGSGADAGAVATGRLNLTQVSAGDKAQRLTELQTERRQQLEALARALSSSSGGGSARRKAL